MPFPEIPQDLFDEFDWSAFNTLTVARQIDFVNTLTDEQLTRLGTLVDGYEAAAARRTRVLQIAHGFLAMGIRLAPLVLL
jgi:hypothetical protein